MNEYPVARHYRDSKILEIGDGTPEVQLMLIAREAAFSDALPPFHQRLVNSMFTLSTLVGLSVAQLTQGTIVGNLGFSDVAFPKPLFHGDTWYAESEVT